MGRLAAAAALALLVGCGSPNERIIKKATSATESLGKAEAEADSIAQKWPETKKPIKRLKIHINDAREDVADIQAEAVDSEGSDWFMWILQGFLAVSGIGIAVSGIKTPDPWDTPVGVGMFGLSICLNFFAEILAGVFFWIVVVFGLYWIIIACKHYVANKYGLDKTPPARYIEST